MLKPMSVRAAKSEARDDLMVFSLDTTIAKISVATISNYHRHRKFLKKMGEDVRDDDQGPRNKLTTKVPEGHLHSQQNYKK